MSNEEFHVVTHSVSDDMNFKQQGDKLQITSEEKELTQDIKRLHIQEFGDSKNGDCASIGAHFEPLGKTHSDCTGIGAHFDPLSKTHSDCTAKERHVDDPGNIKMDANGLTSNSNKISIVKLDNPYGRMAVRERVFEIIRKTLEGNGGKVDIEAIGASYRSPDYELQLTSSPFNLNFKWVSSVRMERKNQSLDYDCNIVFDSEFEKKLLPDIVGLKLIDQILRTLNLNGIKLKFAIEVNHEGLLQRIIEHCGVSEEQCEMVLSLIKANIDSKKIGPNSCNDWSEVERELLKVNGVNEESIDQLKQYVSLKGRGDEFLKAILRSELATNPQTQKALEHLLILEKYCSDMKLEYDLGLPPTISDSMTTYFKISIYKQPNNPENGEAAASSTAQRSGSSSIIHQSSRRSDDFTKDSISSNRAIFLPLNFCAQPHIQNDFSNRLQSQSVLLHSLEFVHNTINATVSVMNLSFSKKVIVKYTLDGWISEKHCEARYSKKDGEHSDKFVFQISLSDFPQFQLDEERTLMFAVSYETEDGRIFWDNNSGRDYRLTCRFGEDVCVAFGGRFNIPAPRVNFTLLLEDLIELGYQNDLPITSRNHQTVFLRRSLTTSQEMEKIFKKEQIRIQNNPKLVEEFKIMEGRMKLWSERTERRLKKFQD